MCKTLRQMFYAFVDRGWMAKEPSEYERLKQILGDGSPSRSQGQEDHTFHGDPDPSGLGMSPA